MYRFVSSINPVILKKAYLKEYNVKLLQKKLDKLMAAYPEIKDILPKDITAKKLLIGNFKFLTKVYCAFTTYLNGKSKDDRTNILKAFVDGGFKYDSHKRNISRFLTDEDNGFEIHNCVYCDLEDVTSFIKADGTKVRRFATEHVLDKGDCPLVALSLYNFVPSCNSCNGADIKGTKTIGDTEEEIAQLSPTAEGYDFNGKVTFEIKIKGPNATDLKAVDHPDDYEVDFYVREPIYQKSINLFELKPRYNNKKEKRELLLWRDKRRNNPDNIVQQYADIRKITFKEMFEEMFELQLRKQEHYTMEKARRDVMLIR
jgi:hypothetical protein